MKCYKNFTFIILASLILSSHLYNLVNADDSEVDDETAFSYKEETGKGPREWGKINPHWRVCGIGKLQSPIDLLNQRVQVLPALGKLKRDYKPAPAVVKNRGHDICVWWRGDAGKMHINGTIYKLLQCHWHTPSEHTINGSSYEMELHLVHLSSDGKLAVTGIVYEYGRPDPFLSKLLHHIKSLGKEEKEVGIVNPGDIKFGSRKYYRYIGSLTVPPCTEGVIWTIGNKVRTVSREQVRALKEEVHDGYEKNARPTNELNGRPIWFYSPFHGEN